MREYTMKRLSHLAVALAALVFVTAPARADSDFYTENEILNAAAAARGFFRRENGYILRGSRRGLHRWPANGELSVKNAGKRKVYWQGPSVGFDFGGNAAKSMTLVYNIKCPDDIFKLYPGVSGSFYFVAGVGVNYQQAGDVILAPIARGECGLSTLWKRAFLDSVLGVRWLSSIKGKIGKG